VSEKTRKKDKQKQGEPDPGELRPNAIDALFAAPPKRLESILCLF